MALGKVMRLLLIVLDISLIAYIISHMIFRLLPVNEPVFWLGALIEVGLSLMAFKFWISSSGKKNWNSDRSWTLILVIVAMVWPIIARYTDYYLLKSAAAADLLFFGSALTLLVWSSFKAKPPPTKSGKSRS